MAEKQDLKRSEARILVYLAVSKDSNCYPQTIAGKLDMDYNYLLHILQSMVCKGWIRRRPKSGWNNCLRSYYHISRLKAPLNKAKKLLASGKHDKKKN